jgi:transcriptional regulator with XRE-family HTH domain
MTEDTMKLADLRKRAGLSQQQVAERMGVGQSQVSRIEMLYPDVMFPTLRRYLSAIDAEIRFHGHGGSIPAGKVVPDPNRTEAEARRKDPTRGGRRAAVS